MTASPHRPALQTTHAGWRTGRLRGPRRPDPGAAARLLVLKVGGSLLSRPDWPALVRALLSAHGHRPCCLVVGGGAVVDGLRTLDAAVPGPPPLVHALAIDAMGLTGRLVAGQLGLAIRPQPPHPPPATPLPVVLDAAAWLGSEPAAATLPSGWQVTSDTIAALVAVVHGGDLLVAKSAPPPPCSDDAAADPLPALSRAGWVDDHFPRVAGTLHEIGWAAPDDGSPPL